MGLEHLIVEALRVPFWHLLVKLKGSRKNTSKNKAGKLIWLWLTPVQADPCLEVDKYLLVVLLSKIVMVLTSLGVLVRLPITTTDSQV